MDTNIENIYNIVQAFKTDKGGDFAQNGFSFQFACLMLDILKRFRDNKDFMACGEQIDDYMLIDDFGINIYQCKNFKNKSYTLNSLTNSCKGKSLWNKILDIYQELKKIIGSTTSIYYWILINKTNKISLTVNEENKKAYDTSKYEDCLKLSLISKEEKDSLNENGILLDTDFENFYIYRVLGYDTFDSEVKSFMEEIINSKYSENVKYNPPALYNTLTSKIKERSIKKTATNLQVFTEDIENVLRFNTDIFYDFVNVVNLIKTTFHYDISKVNETYNYLKCAISPLKANMTEFKDYLEIKSLIKSGKDFDEIINYCTMKKCLIKCTTIDEIIALILLCKGEKI